MELPLEVVRAQLECSEIPRAAKEAYVRQVEYHMGPELHSTLPTSHAIIVQRLLNYKVVYHGHFDVSVVIIPAVEYAHDPHRRGSCPFNIVLARDLRYDQAVC